MDSDNMKLTDIKGVGPKMIEYLNKMNIYTINDLIEYYPYKYNIYRRSDINSLNDNDKIIIDGVIETNPNIYYFKKLNRIIFKLNTGTNILNVTIFNRAFIRKYLNLGSNITVLGKYDKKNNSVIASDIKLCSIDKLPKIEPVYHLITGVNNKKISGIIDDALKNITNAEDNIPEYIINKYDFIEKIDAIKMIHNPSSTDSFNKARLRLVYEELFVYMIKIYILKNIHNKEIGLKRNVEKEKLDYFIDNLPFKLTDDQLKSSYQIYDDLISSKRMNRLLQGDVGSGKTIVSFIALYINYLGGYQGVLMAPTEILAGQHFNNIKNIFKDYNINIELLTGNVKTKEKKSILEKLEKQDIDILIGTHALISDNVKFNNLGLVITDEQHRFGVNQRETLKNKGNTPDILYMSATPIPRTYALTLYGDMDISSIMTRPNNRGIVTTLLKKNSEIKDVLNLMYQELKFGHQIYVIAPLIEGENDNNVDDLYNKMDKAFGKLYKLDILHGKMSNNKKEEVMNNFKNNNTQILISTTVVEVGVDVGNASMIVIFNAEKFGLSQLHQLRGRVGRSNIDSYCVLISDYDKERLNVIVSNTDGFKISEEDFKLRGEGDLFGFRQSGDMIFKLADIKRDFNIITRVKNDCDELIKNNLIDYNLYVNKYNIKNIDVKN